jgi:AraC-like DNA-binding protein
MKHVYFQKQTNAYFSVLEMSDFRMETDFTRSHPWYTVIILNKLSGELMIDDYRIQDIFPNVIFISPGQRFLFSEGTVCEGYAISFNKEFYCIEYHDADVSCNGLLFVNNYSLVQIQLNEMQQTIYNNTVKEIAGEFEQDDNLQAEMLKNLLKNLLIRSSRLFRMQNSMGEPDDVNIDFSRKFSELVEKHFKEIKQVEIYADMMGIAPASLTKKLQKYGIDSPSRIIKNRVITEAKRLLIYSDKSVKEIASALGYNDQHHFSRLFYNEAGISPTHFKKQCLRIF